MVQLPVPTTRLTPATTCDAVYLGYDWSGFYAGVHAGVVFAASQWDLLAPGTDEHTATGFAGGVQIGYQKQWGNMVAGVEISYTATDADVSSHTTFLAASAALSTEVSNLLLVTGRLGYANDNSAGIPESRLRQCGC